MPASSLDVGEGGIIPTTRGLAAGTLGSEGTLVRCDVEPSSRELERKSTVSWFWEPRDVDGMGISAIEQQGRLLSEYSNSIPPGFRIRILGEGSFRG